MFPVGLSLALMAMPSLHEVPVLVPSERVFADQLNSVCEMGPIIASLEVRVLAMESWAFTIDAGLNLPSDADGIESVLCGYWMYSHDWLDPAPLGQLHYH